MRLSRDSLIERLDEAQEEFARERECWDVKHGEWRIRVEQAHALCGLFWAVRLWLECEYAWRSGAKDPFALNCCPYLDCGIRRR